MNAEQKEITEEEYEDYVTEVYGDIDVCGYSYPAGQVLREIDPTAFRCGIADMPEVWICGECGEEYETEDEANECCQDSEE